MIIGLGNPGHKYLLNRHNIGFMALDYFTKAMAAENAKPKIESKAITVSFSVDGEQVLLVKPQTYMNLSGESVSLIASYYKVPLEKMIVVQDDLDQNFGQIKIKSKSGDGGHNGIKSLIEQLGSNEFLRIKLGIGRPPHPEMKVADFVLQNFSQEEQKALPEILNACVDAIESLIFDGAVRAMNKFNSKSKEE